jgi:hypothetical protein
MKQFKKIGLFHAPRHRAAWAQQRPVQVDGDHLEQLHSQPYGPKVMQVHPLLQIDRPQLTVYAQSLVGANNTTTTNRGTKP